MVDSVVTLIGKSEFEETEATWVASIKASVWGAKPKRKRWLGQGSDQKVAEQKTFQKFCRQGGRKNFHPGKNENPLLIFLP